MIFWTGASALLRGIFLAAVGGLLGFAASGVVVGVEFGHSERSVLEGWYVFFCSSKVVALLRGS